MINEASFNQIVQGKQVGLYTLTTPDGITAQITNYGAKEWGNDKNFCTAEIRNFIERWLSYELQNCWKRKFYCTCSC